MSVLFTDIIREGEKKFRYGLLWWFVQAYQYDNDFGSDYKYSAWIANYTEQQIHDKLLNVISYAIMHPHEPCFDHLFKAINYIRSENELPYDRNKDIVDHMADSLYSLLTVAVKVSKPKSKATSEIYDLIWYAANRVIRNYIMHYGEALVNPDDVYNFVYNYYLAYKIKPPVDIP